MRVRVLYLGMLRDVAGREKDELHLPDSASLGELFSTLQSRIPKLAELAGAIALAVNY